MANSNTSIGSLKGRINYDTVNELPSIVSNVTLTDLDLGVLTEDQALFKE